MNIDIGAYHATSAFKNEWNKTFCRKPVAKVDFFDHKLRTEALEKCFVHCIGAPGSFAFLVAHFAKNFFTALEHAYRDPFRGQTGSYATTIKKYWGRYVTSKQTDSFVQVMKRHWTQLRESCPTLLEDFLAVIAFPALRTALIIKELSAAIIHPAFAYKE
ncbi:hypothetical protein [Parachlamydia sp. AcF125]|uniref:hypothetical protein n=1 Tax=Parachlamydia sp. AcF125 TaxID=2795736 RepID=UPI001BC92DF5|nr:hypothetical protein [Parachlamydia sp. AcF125]MBS4168050.1 hypothetical protein [Parachlamydia sp. AcF125]